jgi:hypothetical protein
MAAVFLYAAGFKLAHPEESVDTVKLLSGFPAEIAILMLTLLVTLELYIGFGVLLLSDRAQPMRVALGCLVVFSLYLYSKASTFRIMLLI